MSGLRGRTALLTGVTGGLGLHTAVELARRGAALVVTARDAGRGEAAAAQIRQQVPGAEVELELLDLADLDDVSRAVEALTSRRERLDLVVANAGIMVPPPRRSAQGLELQIATNHLGHFALLAGLWPRLRSTPSRVVTVSSLAHRNATAVDLRSLQAGADPRPYRRWRSYSESKLANLLFSRELQRRATAAGLDVTSVAAHPGVASTELFRTGLAMGAPRWVGTLATQVAKVFAQSAEAGSQPLVMAATDPGLQGGELVGPLSLGGFRGAPGVVQASPAADDQPMAEALWAASERAAGLDFTV